MGPKQRGDRSQLCKKLWGSLLPSNNTYEHFEHLGRFNVQPLPEFVNPTMALGDLFNRIDNQDREKILAMSGDYVFSRSTKTTLDISCRKMDIQVCKDYLHCPFYSQAVALTIEKYKDALSVTHMTFEEVMLDLDLTKAPGYFETWRGFRSKLDCVRAGVIHEYADISITNEVPIWKVSGKEEIKLRSDYMIKRKQRTFIIEPFNLLYHHKRIYGNQSAGMKGAGWSAYGFNPYEGGTHMLATSLNQHKRKGIIDIVGMDRRFPLMEEVYKIKDLFITPDPFQSWVRDNNICSTLVLPNGDVIKKSWGNNSGSGSTTLDNILAMDIMTNHTFLRAGAPYHKLLNLVHAAIFGDDLVWSDDLPLSDDTLREVFIETFAMYGYELDPYKTQSELEGLDFLGFVFKKVGDQYVPCYNLERLAFSFSHVEGVNIDPEKEISKMMSLMLMSTGHGPEIYNQFRSSLLQVIVRTDCDTANRIKKCGLGDVPTYEEAFAWFAGFEGKEVVGIKFNLLDNGQT